MSYRYIIDDLFKGSYLNSAALYNPIKAEVGEKSYMGSYYYTRDVSGVIILDQSVDNRGRYIIQDEDVLKTLFILYGDLRYQSINLLNNISSKKVQYGDEKLPLITLDDIFDYIGIKKESDIEKIVLMYHTALLDKDSEIYRLKKAISTMIQNNTGIDKDILESLSE